MSDQQPPSPRWISGIEPPKDLLSATGTQILQIECREQPQRLRELIRSYASDPVLLAQLQTLRNLAAKEGPVIFLGMGASYCASISGSVFSQAHGRSAFAVDAGEWLHYSTAAWNCAALSVLLTTSGESAELVELFQNRGTRALALICNNPASTCWRLSENRLPILAGPEYGNATKTYTNAAAASIILASEILRLPWENDAEAVAETFATSLDRVFALRQSLEEFCRGAVNIEVIGRGPALGAAIMSALCIREMTGLRAAPHTGAGFKHGPILDVDATHVSIIFAVGHVADLGIKLARECNRRGGKVVLVSTDDCEPTDLLFPIRLDPVPDLWEGLTSILVPQALTLAMVERTGSRLPPRFQYGVMEQ